MTESSRRSLGSLVTGVLMLGMGALVFLVRLRHEGPYVMPAEGNLLAAVLALAIGAWLLFGASRAFGAGGKPFFQRALTLVAVVAAPVVLFFALYASLAETEEVVDLRVRNQAGEAVALRLWIMDADGYEWANMPQAKAVANDLGSQQVEMLRAGQVSCRRATIVGEREVVARNAQLSRAKYRVRRLAEAIGVFGSEIPATLVSVRLEPCATS